MNRSIHGRFAKRPLFLALLSALPCVAAHAADPVIPNAGTLLQQTQPALPPTPSQNSTGLNIVQPPSAQLPSTVAFRVEHIEIAGNTHIDTATLHALVAGSEGRDLTLADLGALAARLTDYYHAHGYPLARAIVPAQTMQGGTVRIDIIEARFGKVGLENGSRVRDGLLQATLGGLQSGAVVTDSEMDRSLLLLSDIPGVQIGATLKPGAQVGTSDLQVVANAAPMVVGSVSADNWGEQYSGRPRLSAVVSVYNPLHQGDEFSVAGVTSGADMNYGRVSYDALLDGAGTRAGAAFSALDYRLGGDLSPLGAHGTAQVVSAWLKQPLIRGRVVNLYAQVQYDHYTLNDSIDTSNTATDRHLDNVTATLSGDLRDGLLAGAATSWNASWTYGHTSFSNDAAQAADALARDTQGGFSKLNLSAARLQEFGGGNQLFVSVSGQVASGNLDSSQQLIAGGPTSVRAYDVNAVSGDSGALFTMELRHTMAHAWFGQWQAVAFLDAAHVRINRNAFEAGSNIANMSGVGVGLNWAGPYRTSASVSVAAPIGGRPEVAGNTASARAWLQFAKGF